jgi:CheY-like chemotaxis protein
VNKLAGKRVLIVEDNWVQANDLAQHFDRMNVSVIGPAMTLAAGIRMAPDADVAILDLNLRGQLVFPLADALNARDVPIVFYTAYNSIVIPGRFRFACRLEKPAGPRQIGEATSRALSLPRPLADPAEIIELLPKLRLTARLMLADPFAADRLVERTLEAALDNLQSKGMRNTEDWLHALMREVYAFNAGGLMT